MENEFVNKTNFRIGNTESAPSRDKAYRAQRADKLFYKT